MFRSSSHGKSLQYSARHMYVTTQLYLTWTEVCLPGTRTQQESSQSKRHCFFPAVAEIKFVFQLQNPHSPCLPPPLILPPPPPPSRFGGGGSEGCSISTQCLFVIQVHRSLVWQWRWSTSTCAPSPCPTPSWLQAPWLSLSGQVSEFLCCCFYADVRVIYNPSGL